MATGYSLAKKETRELDLMKKLTYRPVFPTPGENKPEFNFDMRTWTLPPLATVEVVDALSI